mmetsp:Transcript_94650/g.294741  ORF Transcript_94650/g.294741 Transcript_94650/m.294741 type:complete len:203 (+) Transcript_94650:246-854(+)
MGRLAARRACLSAPGVASSPLCGAPGAARPEGSLAGALAFHQRCRRKIARHARAAIRMWGHRPPAGAQLRRALRPHGRLMGGVARNVAAPLCRGRGSGRWPPIRVWRFGAPDGVELRGTFRSHTRGVGGLARHVAEAIRGHCCRGLRTPLHLRGRRWPVPAALSGAFSPRSRGMGGVAVHAPAPARCGDSGSGWPGARLWGL